MKPKKKCFGLWKDADLYIGYKECRTCKLLQSCKKLWIKNNGGN